MPKTFSGVIMIAGFAPMFAIPAHMQYGGKTASPRTRLRRRKGIHGSVPLCAATPPVATLPSFSIPRRSMRPQRYHIRFPADNLTRASQAEAYFTIMEDGKERRIAFHDYADIYDHPGLYEQLFYQRLKCTSPAKLTELLRDAATKAGDDPSQMRVLDVGAGNGMVGELLVQHGAARVVGIDNIHEAERAADRDRPGAYDAYYVTDLTKLSPDLLAELKGWNFDAMTTVAALGFGDIPVAAFAAAYNLVRDDGWVAFNIKETFLDTADTSGFSRLVKHMVHDDYLKLHRLERYRHRLSIEGNMLYYYAVVGRKRRDIDDACLAGIQHETH
jgi:SAM-dependent methyltransferase